VGGTEGIDWYVENCKSKNKEIYDIGLKPLSKDEEKLIKELTEEFHKGVKETNFESIIEEYCTRERILLDEDQKEYIKSYLRLNSGYYGIEKLLDDESIEEICLIGIGKPIYVYVSGKGWIETNLYFRNEEGAINVINKMARSLGRRVTYQNPRLNAVLKDGSRIHASIKPISNIELTIRKFRKNPITVFDLLNEGIFDLSEMAFLSTLFQSDRNIIIAGNTSSGKTTTLNTLFSFVPLNERILLIEETPEINIPHAHQIKLISNEELQISMESLVYDSLRMRPDRVIISEIRSKEEMKAFIETLLSGQARGSYTTFHAQSSEEVIKRFISAGILALDVSSIDFIAVQRRMLIYDRVKRKCWEERKGIEISEVNKGKINKIFYLDYKEKKKINRLDSSKKIEEIANSFMLTKKEFFEEIENRKKFFEENLKLPLSFNDSLNIIQRYLFESEKSKEIGEMVKREIELEKESC
jgi:type IV secretory pathway ATPase VirB11/archaellum biosynthesis ATPase